MQPVKSLSVRDLARRGLGLFGLLLIIDGALRKWVFPDYEQLVFVIKDILLFGVAIYVALANRGRLALGVPTGIAVLLFAYVAWVLLMTLNPGLPNLLVALWGVKSHVLYAVLFLLVPLAWNGPGEALGAIGRIYPWIVIPVCGLGFLQIASPLDSPLNQYVSGSEEIASFGEGTLARVTGPFSYLSGMAAFVQVAVLLGAFLLILGRRSAWMVTATAFALASLPVTGSRAVIVFAAMGGVLMMLIFVFSGLLSLWRAVGYSLLLTLLVAAGLFVQDQGWTALINRAQGGAEDQFRIFTAFTNAFDYFEVAGFTGFGTGAVNLGAPVLAGDLEPFSWLPGNIGFEEESGRLVLELGIVGWLLSILMRLALLLWATKLAMQGRTSTVRAVGGFALPVMAYGVHVGSGVFAPALMAVSYWFAAALLALAQREHAQAGTGSGLTSTQRRGSVFR